MASKAPLAFLLSAALSCAAPLAVAEETGGNAECQVCTARHQSLQALQRARAAKACAGDDATDCAPAPAEASPLAGLPQGEDDEMLRLPDGRPIGQ